MRIIFLAIILLPLSACHKSAQTNDTAASQTKAIASAQAPAGEQCDGEKSWLAKGFAASHAAVADTEDDCAFYQASWQHFAEATAGDADKPAFLAYPNVANLFGADASPLMPKAKSGFEVATLRVAKLPNDPTANPQAAFGSGIRQAGDVEGILADHNGNPIYYSIHVNPAFKDFTTQNGLRKASDLRNAKDTLAFSDGTPESLGVAEYKAAWQVIDPKHIPPGFIWTTASVPTIRKVGDTLTVDASTPRTVTLVLIAFHVAFVLDNHPEMIWATFEHLGKGSTPSAPISDIAPAAINRPPAAVQIADGNRDYALFPAHTKAENANIPADPKAFDEATQRFSASTPVYRVYPGSKVDGDTPDGAVDALNVSMAGLLSGGSDSRQNYRLIGAVWLKHPGSSFGVGKRFFNQDGQSTDDKTAMLSGEGALSSTAMESFTQAPESFPNCFSCHNTTVVKTNTKPAKIILAAKELNVSHVMSRFLSELP